MSTTTVAPRVRTPSKPTPATARSRSETAVLRARMIGYMLAHEQFTVRLLTESGDPVEIERRAADEVSMDELLAEWAIGTDPRVHIEALQALFDSGINHVTSTLAEPTSGTRSSSTARRCCRALRRYEQ